MTIEVFSAASVGMMPVLVTNRANWIKKNKAIPDSTSMNMTRQNVLPSVMPKFWSSMIVLTCRYTFKILNTIKPVTRTFTAMEIIMAVLSSVISHPGPNTWPRTLDKELLAPPVIQIARSNRFRPNNVKIRLTDLGMQMLRLKE